MFTRAKEHTNALRNSTKRVPVPEGKQARLPSATPRRASAPAAPAVSSPAPEKEVAPSRNIGIMLVGVGVNDLAPFLDSILMVCDEKDVTPVFLTDVDNFSAFRERGLAFEHLPSREAIGRFG